MSENTETRITMKHTSLVLMLAIITFIACNQTNNSSDSSQQIPDTTNTSENKNVAPLTTCYMGSMGKDTFQLNVDVKENEVTGNLAYLFHEKDRQKGTLDGYMAGDTLLANYTFNSEGQTSVRQVAFLLKDEKAIEGYGDIEEKDGAMVFKDVKSLQFGQGLNLTKVPCVQ